MVRSMYSGVTGMKAHQTKMDVIGNNIANVNTYGFKSSRATFRDVYYQSIRNAAAPSTTAGGTNPSSVGYGATVGSVDLLMTPSTVTNTGNPMDVAINGDGFFQVEDADGNTFYTRAGMLDIDASGNLVDMNGYYVLGVSGSPVGQAPSGKRINVIQQMGAVPQTLASVQENINGVSFAIKAGNPSIDGNVSFTFAAAQDLPIGQPAEAVVGSSNITVRLNANHRFASLDELNAAVNDAITAANGGKTHPAGKFTVSMDQEKFAASGTNPAGLTGLEICGRNFGYTKGKLDASSEKNGGTGSLFGGFEVLETGDRFSGNGAVSYQLKHDEVNRTFTVSATVDGKVYSAVISEDNMNEAGKVLLKRTDAAAPTDVSERNQDSITMSFPTLKKLKAVSDDPNAADGAQLTFAGFTNNVGTAVPSYPSRDLGLESRSFKLSGGTAGGAVTVKDLTGIAIGADGVITANHAVLGEKEVGRIDLANFNNPAALVQCGNSYFAVSANSGAAGLYAPGNGGAGTLKTSSLEMSNVDLSQEFADMITTQRGYQANSRLITVSDTMLEELINLKR